MLALHAPHSLRLPHSLTHTLSTINTNTLLHSTLTTRKRLRKWIHHIPSCILPRFITSTACLFTYVATTLCSNVNCSSSAIVLSSCTNNSTVHHSHCNTISNIVSSSRTHISSSNTTTASHTTTTADTTSVYYWSNNNRPLPLSNTSLRIVIVWFSRGGVHVLLPRSWQLVVGRIVCWHSLFVGGVG